MRRITTDADKAPDRARWARLRFSIVGPLLTCPPESGELAARITELAGKPWEHLTTGEAIRLSFKTIERWFYIAREAKNPFAALERKVPAHADTHPSVSPAVEQAIRAQYAAHPRWSYQLHHDNLVAQSKGKADIQIAVGCIRHHVDRTGACLVQFAASRPLHDLRALVFGDHSLHLREQLILRALAAASLKQDHACAVRCELLEQQHLMRVATREPIRIV